MTDARHFLAFDEASLLKFRFQRPVVNSEIVLKEGSSCCTVVEHTPTEQNS